MDFLTPEFLSLIGGSIVGFVFRHMAEKRENEKQLFEHAMAFNKQTTDNQNQAVNRVSVDAGKVVRRVIVISVLFGTIMAPFILPFFSIPTFVEVDQTSPEGLFGLFPETTKKFFVEIPGYLYTSENRQILLSIVGFYFGTAAASRK